MRYFRNSELTRLYNVSDKAVRNWIDATQQGKLKLELLEYDDKTYIADTLHNNFILEELVHRGKKFRNRRTHKELAPSSNFYSLYGPKQVIDIANSLDKYREIPTHYRYFGEGATYWDAYLHKLYDAGISNILTATIELLRLDREYLDSLFDNYEYVNVVDVGVGNSLAAKELLQYLHDKGKLKRYIGIDSSKDLLDIAEQNIDNWFSNTIKIEKYVRDINYERFAEALAADSFGKDATATINVLLFLGATVGNFREPSQALQTIRESMGKDDILITSDKLDSENARRFFDFNIESDKTTLSLRNRFLLDLLAIEESFYDVEQFFDEQQKSRFIQVRLKVEVSIQFKVGSFQKKIELRRGESILLFRIWEWTDRELVNLYEKNKFSQLRVTKSRNQEYILIISKIDNSIKPS